MLRRTVLALMCLALTLNGMARPSENGAYSKHAYQLWDEVAGNPNPVIVYSTDRKSSVTARWFETGGEGNEEHVVLTTSGQIGVLRVDIGPGVDSELLWSPDSNAFFVTYSNGGNIGDFHVLVIDTIGGKLCVRDLSELIYRTFGNPVRCDENPPPNVAGITWVGATHRIWVAAQVLPTSICDSMGTFRAYEVDPSQMKVLRSLNQLDAKRQLRASLGEELKDADDSCIRNPKSCYVDYNHPELHPK